MRLSKFLTLAFSLVAVVASAMAGCGGGGGDSTASAPATTTETTPALSKAELISQGDAICAEVNAAVGSVGASAAEATSQATQVASLYAGMVESIRRLGTPEDAAGYPEFIAAAEKLSKVEGEAKLAAERGSGEAATDPSATLEEFQTEASVYGFKDCAEGPRAPTPSSSGAPPAEEEGGVEVAPEVSEEAGVEEAAPEEVAPETGGAGGSVEEAAPEGGGTSGGSSGGVGPG